MSIRGTVIDKAFVLALPDYASKASNDITEADLSVIALKNLQAYQKDAYDLANAYKEEYGNGVSTLICIYNASGVPLTFRSNYDSSGHIGKYPYDSRIENGQWSVVLHVHTSGAARGSVGVLGYNLADRVLCNAWSSPFDQVSYSNSAWAQVEDAATEYGPTDFSVYVDKASSGGSGGTNVKWGYAVSYQIGTSSSSIFQVVVSKCLNG